MSDGATAQTARPCAAASSGRPACTSTRASVPRLPAQRLPARPHHVQPSNQSRHTVSGARPVQPCLCDAQGLLVDIVAVGLSCTAVFGDGWALRSGGR
ncbi:MAG: hypothetical protein ACRDSF_02265 [Pseudonocardiaceae bacterium]